MPVMVAEPESTFLPAPAGLHRAVCVDVVDLGMVETTFGTKRMVRLVWQIEESMPDGRMFSVGQRYAASLHEKANLRKVLESWRGKAFTAEELKGFDLEKLIGINCQLNVVQTVRDGKTFANVQTVVPPAKGSTVLQADGSYTRVKDREPNPAFQNTSGDTVDNDDDDPIPF